MKRSFGDRRDGILLRKIDPMHFITPLIMPHRTANEAFISERIDLTNAVNYLAKRNADAPEYKYNIFQLIVTAMLKTVTLRPKLNRFIASGNMYQRREVTASFVVKKIFDDEGGEALAFLHAKPDSSLFTVHDDIYKTVTKCRSETMNSTDESMDILNRLPRFISKPAIAFIRFLDRHGWVPKSLVADDPYYSSILISNLGSIKLHSGYHHLADWGTNSLFCIVGEMKKRPYYDDDGKVTMKMSIDLGLTVDERIADGYYFSKSVRLLRTLLEKPELLETPLSQEVDY